MNIKIQMIQLLTQKILWNNCLKVTLIWILAMQHSNTRNVIRGGLQFFVHTFLEGRIFGLLTWEGLKFLGPHFWNNTGPPPPPNPPSPIVNDRSLTTVFYFLFLGLIQVFVGNTDENTIVYNELNGSIVARYTRFQPTAWHNHISMRVELYGCKGTFFGNILLLWNSVKNTNKSLFDLSLLAAFTTLLLNKY